MDSKRPGGLGLGIIIPKRVVRKDNSVGRKGLSPAVRRAVKASSTRNKHRKKLSERSFESDTTQYSDASSAIADAIPEKRLTTPRLRREYIEQIHNDIKDLTDSDNEATEEAASARIWARLKSMENSGTYSAAPMVHTRDGIDHYVVNDELQPVGDTSSEGEELLGELPCDSEFLDATQEEEFCNSFAQDRASMLPPIAASMGRVRAPLARAITAPCAFKAGVDAALLGMVKQSERSVNFRNIRAPSVNRTLWLPKHRANREGKLILQKVMKYSR